MDEKLIDRMIQEAKEPRVDTGSGHDVPAAHARQLQETVLALRAADLPEPAIADRLGIGVPDVRNALRAAISLRPRQARREERFPYELHVLLAAKLRRQPGPLLDLARSNLSRIRATPRARIAEGWLDRWGKILELPAGQIEPEMLKDDEEGRDMRQMSPFAGALDQEERMIALAKARFMSARQDPVRPRTSDQR